MANTEIGKEISKQNSIKHGLYLHFVEWFPCNLCVNRDKCSDFVPGGFCNIDDKSFNKLMKTDLDELAVLKQLIFYNQVRLNRATSQLANEPYHLELSRMSAELRNLIQTYHIIKQRKEVEKDAKQTTILSHLPKESQLSLIQRE